LQAAADAYVTLPARKMSALGQKRTCPRNVRSYPGSDILCGERNGTERDFSHPISHRTPQYRVGNHGIGRFVITQKCWIFRIKRNCTT
ncbi:MAG: hypothetical protein WB563_12265, partial [Pseudolabrys sp.]